MESSTYDSIRHAASQWAVGLHEPLIGSKSRLYHAMRLDEETRLHPVWAGVWFAGLIADAIQSLPEDDPWRSLSGRIHTGDDTLVAQGRYPVPEHTGATGRNGAFGSWHDASDLRTAEMGDPHVDIGLAAVADPLPKEPAALLAFAGLGWAHLNTAILLAERESEQSVFELCEPAVRWAYYRRGIYVGRDDPYVVFSAFTWLYRADMSALGSPWKTEEVDSQIDENRVDNSAYAARYLGE